MKLRNKINRYILGSGNVPGGDLTQKSYYEKLGKMKTGEIVQNLNSKIDFSKVEKNTLYSLGFS